MSPEGGRGALLIADSDIPTTHLVARELREAFATLEVRVAPDFLFRHPRLNGMVAGNGREG